MVLEDTGRELIESCQRGERDSFRTLFEAHKDKVYSIALRYSGDEAEAMDIAQETFLKLFSCIRFPRRGQFRIVALPPGGDDAVIRELGFYPLRADYGRQHQKP
jgi:hypothetical protein